MKTIGVTVCVLAFACFSCVAIAGDSVSLLGWLRISNFQCEYYEWAAIEGWWCWYDVRTIDSYTTFISNTDAMTLAVHDDSRVIVRLMGDAVVNQSEATVDLTGETTCDGGHFGKFSFDLAWSTVSCGNCLSLILDPGCLWLCSGPNAYCTPALVPAYSTMLNPDSTSIHVSGDMGNSSNVIFRLRVVPSVPEPCSVTCLMTGIVFAATLMLRRVRC